MKICKIIIKDFHQFKDFELDLTHPETGEPLDKVCLIGSNGTGKTKLLRIIEHIFNPYESTKKEKEPVPLISFIKLKSQREDFWVIRGKRSVYHYFKEPIENIKDWKDELYIETIRSIQYGSYGDLEQFLTPQSPFYALKLNTHDFYLDELPLLVVSPAENNNIDIEDVPQTNVNEAIQLLDYMDTFHEVSSDTISDFWKTLIYHLKKRDNDFQEFQNLEENQNRTVREVREEFDSKHPKILDSLAKLWDEILGKAGLEFDTAGASNPIQLTDNLKAYIKLKSTGERINYNDLSTGIRNFIFKVGHIYSLYFNRNIERGFLLIDEPENSLFPDFLYDLVDIYQSITHNTQIFMATHNPIIAAQFEPYERFILEFDDQGHVQARRGTVPVGDDPNDILSKDFGVRSLLGKEGVKKWERYIELRTIIRMTHDMGEKSKLLEEFMTIGNEYNFSNALS